MHESLLSDVLKDIFSISEDETNKNQLADDFIVIFLKM